MAIPGVTPVYSGKVRELYAIGEDRLLLVASDRVSTFDVVLPTLVPDKGRVLTGLSAFWFARLAGITPNHLLSTSTSDLPDAWRAVAPQLQGRMMLCRRLEMVPFECVVRGYLAGSGWREYQRTGTVCGVRLPAGLREADRLPEPIFTPATKAPDGEHDLNVPFAVMVDTVGRDLAESLRATSLLLYADAASYAAERGVLLADTKFEFGLHDGRPVLADELLTPDSSRYWPADDWQPGSSPPSLDKQFVRNHVLTAGWDRTPPAPSLPDEVVAATRARYLDVYERLTGEPFDAWLARP